jgi:hypothetical protein
MPANPNTPFGLQPYQRKGSASYRANTHMYYVCRRCERDLCRRPRQAHRDPGQRARNPDRHACQRRHVALITGAVVGFVGVGAPTQSAPNGSFFASSGTPGPIYKPASAASGYFVMVDDDPGSLNTSSRPTPRSSPRPWARTPTS